MVMWFPSPLDGFTGNTNLVIGVATIYTYTARKTPKNQVPRKGDLVLLLGDPDMDTLPYLFVPASGDGGTPNVPNTTWNGLYYPLKDWWSTSSSNSPSSLKHSNRLIQTSTSVPNETVCCLLEDFPEDPMFNVVEVMYFNGIALALTQHIRVL